MEIMAKNPVPAAAPAPAPAVNALPFTIISDLPPPPVLARGGGLNTGEPSGEMRTMLALGAPSGEGDAKKYQAFDVRVPPVPATITDPAERTKAATEAARKVMNRLSGNSRRITGKPGNEGYGFTLRTMADEQGAFVRVYRTDPQPKRPRKAKAAAAPGTAGDAMATTTPPPATPPAA